MSERNIPINGATAMAHAREVREQQPALYALIVDTALRLRRSGRRCSMKQVFELVRCSDAFGQREGETFKLNNTLTAPMARLVMEDCPELEGAFETRRSMADDWRKA